MHTNLCVFEYMWSYTYGQNIPLMLSELLSLMHCHSQRALIESQEMYLYHSFMESVHCEMTVRDVAPQGDTRGGTGLTQDRCLSGHQIIDFSQCFSTLATHRMR